MKNFFLLKEKSSKLTNEDNKGKKYHEAAEILYDRHKDTFTNYIENRVNRGMNNFKDYCEINLQEINYIIEKLT